jgi:hypothetical protein
VPLLLLQPSSTDPLDRIPSRCISTPSFTNLEASLSIEGPFLSPYSIFNSDCSAANRIRHTPFRYILSVHYP